MKNFLIICLLLTGLTVSSTAFSKNDEKSSAVNNTSVSGKVLDKETGEPLVGVMIKISELNMVTYTDFEGNFIFSGIEKGNYNMMASYISYQNCMLQNVSVKEQNNVLKIELNNN